MSEEKTACHEYLRIRNERIYNNLQIFEQLTSRKLAHKPSAQKIVREASAQVQRTQVSRYYNVFFVCIV